MNFIIQLYNTILYQPLFNLSLLIYNLLPIKDFGLVIIILTVLVKLVLLPIELKTIRSQKALKQIQPKMEEIQRKYKDDKEEQAKQLMDLYKQENINPFSSFGLLFLQLPVLWAIFQILNTFTKIFTGNTDAMAPLYSFVSLPTSINFKFLGLIDLSAPNVILAVLVGILQVIYIQKASNVSIFKSAKNPEERAGQMMNIFFIGFFILVLFKLSSALSLYFLISLGITSLQHQLTDKLNKNTNL